MSGNHNQYHKAADPNALPRKLEELSHTRSRLARLAVAAHRNTREDTLRYIVRNDKNKRVVQAAKTNLEEREEAIAKNPPT